MKQLLKIAAGEAPGDLLFTNGRIVNVFTGTVERTSVLVAGGVIAGVGDYTKAGKVVDLDGAYLLPGFIDAHVHIESSHLDPIGFGAEALAKGTTAAIVDPHEIANVLGVKGLLYMAEAAQKTPLDIYYMAPSAVPATKMETAAAQITAEDIRFLLEKAGFFGLGEMMNAPGVIRGVPETLEKLAAAGALSRPIDGHCPRLTGFSLNGYVLAGITTEHEATTAEEAREKLARGMTILIREGSAAKNLEALLPLVDDNTWPYFCFCADDINCFDLSRHGDMLHIVKKAVALGLNPIRAVQLATINAALHYRLQQHGAIAPGKKADLIVVSDLRDFDLQSVYKNGVDSKAYRHAPYHREDVCATVHTPATDTLAFPPPDKKSKARIIQAFADTLYTGEACRPIAEIEGDRNIQKVLVLARHGKNTNQSWGYVEGFGLKEGALASTVAHDSHPLIAVGNSIGEIRHAVQALTQQDGGMIAVRKGEIIATLPLPIAGLMTAAKARDVADMEQKLLAAAQELGCPLSSPFMTLSFLALPVIPKLKITDRGLVDVEAFQFTSLYCE